MPKSFGETKIIQKAHFLQNENLYPYFKAIETTEPATISYSGKEQIMVASNNYLGLTHHPYVQEKAIKAIKKYGTGCTGSRFLNGSLTLHEKVEKRLASFFGHEDALVFSTGMQANLGALSALANKNDCLILDQENHASLIDGARLSFATTYKYKHNDMQSLAKILSENYNKFNKSIIVTDGVFSMSGEVAKLEKIVELKKKWNAMIYLDDAHGLGVLGAKGRGTMNAFNLADQVDINMATFSKSFATLGGVISSNKETIEYIKHTARSFMFSASMPPTAIATVDACLDILEQDTSLVKRLWDNVNYMIEGLKSIDLNTMHSKTPIIPIVIGHELKAMQVTKYLEENGIFACPVISPAVPKENALIRTSYMATHTKDQLDHVLWVLAKAKKKFELPGQAH